MRVKISGLEEEHGEWVETSLQGFIAFSPSLQRHVLNKPNLHLNDNKGKVPTTSSHIQQM